MFMMSIGNCGPPTVTVKAPTNRHHHRGEFHWRLRRAAWTSSLSGRPATATADRNSPRCATAGGSLRSTYCPRSDRSATASATPWTRYGQRLRQARTTLLASPLRALESRRRRRDSHPELGLPAQHRPAAQLRRRLSREFENALYDGQRNNQPLAAIQ